MPTCRRLRPFPCLLALAFAAPLAAQTATEVEGVYQDEVFETASTLVLSPSGRFLWVFSMGALDLAGEGRWTREADGTILLNSDPPVTAPRFELVGRSRDGLPGVAVRLVCETGEAYQFLDAIVEYADGERVARHFRGLEHRTSDDAPRRVAAVQVGSRAFDLISERFPVSEEEANVLTFRFVPNDLGRVDFRNQRATVEGNALSFTWREMPLRYVREGSAAGEELPLLPVLRPPEPEPVRPPADVEVGIGEPADGFDSREGPDVPFDPELQRWRARGPVNLRLRSGDRNLDLGRIDAGGAYPLIIRDDDSRERIESISFPYYDALLPLDEALSRGRSLLAWLEQAGFAPLPDSAEIPGLPPFMVPPFAGEDTLRAANWEAAAQLLTDEEQAVAEMQLYSLVSNGMRATATLFNARRLAREACPHADWSAGGGEWRLYVNLLPEWSQPMPPGVPRR